MTDYFAKLILQALSVVDAFSVALILGSVTILAILEITRQAHQEVDRATKVARSVLGIGILTQLVYRGVDLVTTSNLVTHGEIAMSDLSAAYMLTLVLTLAGVVTFILQKARKLSFQMFVFIEASLWYTMFALTNIASQSESLAEMSGGALSLLTLIIVILLLLVADSTKRYYHKKNRK